MEWVLSELLRQDTRTTLCTHRIFLIAIKTPRVLFALSQNVGS
jgi:hypothetical protein